MAQTKKEVGIAVSANGVHATVTQVAIAPQEMTELEDMTSALVPVLPPESIDDVELGELIVHGWCFKRGYRWGKTPCRSKP